MAPPFFALLMRDAARLLRPSSVVPLVSTEPTESFADHPSASALLALSDVSGLFERLETSSTPHPVSAKLAFYAARVVSTPTYILAALADEAMARAGLVEQEQELDKAPASETAMAEASQMGARKPQIEELT